jgi:DNA-binding MarR family transcriptional regulator
MNCICTLRNIYKAIGECEEQLISKSGLNLNEAMAICALDGRSLCASELADAAGMQCSQTSKIIKSLEDKKLIERHLGTTDKRNMFFALTANGASKLNDIETMDLCMPEVLKQLVKKNVSETADLASH